jgi:hypothetical protein
MSNFGLVLEALGDLTGARIQLERALAIYERTLVPYHPAIADGLTSLGMLVRVQGDILAANSLFRRALAIRQKSLGSLHPHTIAAAENLRAVS